MTTLWCGVVLVDSNRHVCAHTNTPGISGTTMQWVPVLILGLVAFSTGSYYSVYWRRGSSSISASSVASNPQGRCV